jgi:subfamily B ATP-binding cassette protein MsbA
MSIYRRLFVFIKPHWALAALATALLAMTSFGDAVPPQLVRYGVDAAEGMRRSGALDLHKLALMGLGYVGLALVLGGLNACQNYLMSLVGQRIVFDLRRRLYEHLQRLSLGFYEGQRTGDIISRVMGDVEAVQDSILGPVQTLTSDIGRLGGVLVFALSMNVRLTILAFAVAPPLGLMVYLIGQRIRQRFKVVREKAAEVTTVLHDGIAGVRVVRAFAQEPREAARFDEVTAESLQANLAIARLFAVVRPGFQTVVAVGMALVLGFGGRDVALGAMTAGTLTAFVMYVMRMYRPLLDLGFAYNMVQRALAAGERLFELLDREAEIVDAPDARDLEQVEGTVEFDNVQFEYVANVPVLRGISLRAEPGELVALVGPSGAGKTTIINLIPRFYDATEGAVRVDGLDIRSVTQRSLRAHIGIVSQETFLFSGSVRDNIAYGKPDARDDQVIAAAQAANAHDFILELPQGYDTEVGERGIKLSGGQKQRISIARAILRDPRLLIMDEATSSVDTETETLIQRAIERLVHERTTFVIAHRLSTVLHADQILVLDEGRIVERGTHAELLARGGLYRKLYETQFRAAAAEPAAEEEPAPVYEPEVLNWEASQEAEG